MESWLLWSVLLVPALGAPACLLLRSPRAVLAAVCALVAAEAVAAGAAVTAVFTQGPVKACGGWLYLDALSAYHLVILLLVFGLSSLYAWFYFGHEERAGHFSRRTARRFGALWLGSFGAMALVLISNNLGVVWVGIEATTLLTAFLICLHATPGSLEAMWKYLIVCSVGVAFAFIGTLLIGAAAGQAHLAPADALLWTRLRDVAPDLNPTLLKMAFIFLLVGYGTKAGLAPMHNWLPDAHSQAPAPVSAVFSGFLLNSALYCILRCLPLVEAATGHSGWALGLLTLVGLVSIMVAAAFILFQRDAKRLLAYSSVEHLGIIALGVGLGGIGVFAAMFHVLNHSLCKPLAFFSAGRLGQRYGTHDLSVLAGAARSAPLWGGGLFVSLLALIGVAPFAIFTSEFLILKAAIDQGAFVAMTVFLVGLAIVFVAVLRYAIAAAWGQAPEPSAPPPRPSGAEKSTLIEKALVWAPLGLLLVVGLWMPDFMRGAMKEAAGIITGGP